MKVQKAISLVCSWRKSLGNYTAVTGQKRTVVYRSLSLSCFPLSLAIGELGGFDFGIASLDDIYSFTFIFYVLRFLWAAIGMYARSFILAASFFSCLFERAFSLCACVFVLTT